MTQDLHFKGLQYNTVAAVFFVSPSTDFKAITNSKSFQDFLLFRRGAFVRKELKTSNPFLLQVSFVAGILP